jgi:hypothetical protein
MAANNLDSPAKTYNIFTFKPLVNSATAAAVAAIVARKKAIETKEWIVIALWP